MCNIIKRTFVAGLALAIVTASSALASAEPIYVCIENRNNVTVWVSLHFPNGGISNFGLPAGQTERRQGDSNGLECSSFQSFNSPDCPNERSQADFACD
jgi:hypothetical protein